MQRLPKLPFIRFSVFQNKDKIFEKTLEIKDFYEQTSQVWTIGKAHCSTVKNRVDIPLGDSVLLSRI